MEENTTTAETKESSSSPKKSFNPLIIVGVILALALLAMPMILNSKKSQSSENTKVDTTQVSTQESKQVTTISLEEIAKHKDAGDCWMAIENSVYDVSSFVPKHPGEDAILMGCGKDATEMFNSRPNDGTSHSDRARVQLEKYKIGALSSS
jgi:cytochrome b involved in lipid metabolism